MTVNNYQEYLTDLVSILLDKMEELNSEISDSEQNEREYLKGQIMAYYDILDTLKSQAELFDLSLIDLGLEGLNLEKYLTSK